MTAGEETAAEALAAAVAKGKEVVEERAQSRLPHRYSRPLWGHVLQDAVAGYAWWGYTDNDVLLGDVRRVVTPDLKPGADTELLLVDLGAGRNRLEYRSDLDRYAKPGRESVAEPERPTAPHDLHLPQAQSQI